MVAPLRATRRVGDPHHLALIVTGGERESGSGFDIPGTTEIGFGGGLEPGEGNYYLYGLTTSRIRTVRAESHDHARQSEVATLACPGALTEGGDAMRVFAMVRPAVDDVTALVGLDQAGHEVQRIRLIGSWTVVASPRLTWDVCTMAGLAADPVDVHSAAGSATHSRSTMRCRSSK